MKSYRTKAVIVIFLTALLVITLIMVVLLKQPSAVLPVLLQSAVFLMLAGVLFYLSTILDKPEDKRKCFLSAVTFTAGAIASCTISQLNPRSKIIDCLIILVAFALVSSFVYDLYIYFNRNKN